MAWFEGFESGLNPVGEVELFARIGGDRSKPPLLLLHGYPQTHAMWHRVARALAADFRLVSPDLRFASWYYHWFFLIQPAPAWSSRRSRAGRE